MFVKSLKLIGFRNYIEADIEFSAPKTIIIGKNAQGKSNLLEVIQILSHLKSRRASKDAELVNFKLDQSIVHATVSIKTQDLKLNENIEIGLLIRKSGRRTVKINDVPKKPRELLHHIYSVAFMVDDIEIITGSPSRRREWLDSVISQLNLNYEASLSKFENLLSQRNSFLKNLTDKGIFHYASFNSAQREQLTIWDQMYIEAANQLSQLRAEFIEEILPHATKYYQEISGSSTKLNLEYIGKQITEAELNESRAKDLARSYSNLGPHRDDIKFTLDNNDANSYASQGERRTITLALKLAELELHRSKHGEYPILLLDDVLAELDEDRQDYLLESISPEAQVIITTTHIGKHLEKWSDNAQILEIDGGTIIKSGERSMVNGQRSTESRIYLI
jgi:DNA replication and repair protein RecF